MESFFIFLISCITLLSTGFHHLKCQARDSIIGVSDPLIDSTNETLVSAGNIFELGFFTPDGNEKGSRYIGIWYHDRRNPRTIVWVACRDAPLIDTSGVFGIAEDGNVKLWCRNELFSSVRNVTDSKNFNRTLQLLDTGNLVLFDDGKSLWQSFDHPTDTFLPGMLNYKLHSWISPCDPATGNYTFLKDQTVYSIQNRSTDYWIWRSRDAGLLEIYNDVPNYVDQMLSGLDQTIGQLPANSTKYINYSFSRPTDSNNVARVLMNPNGFIQYFKRDKGGWSLQWSEPNDNCSVYERCGQSANCDSRNQPICQCLPGFRPQSKEDWDSGQYSEGCVKEESISCQDAGKMKQFLNLPLLKVESTNAQPVGMAVDKTECESACLSACTCRAYLYRVDNSTSRETGNAQTNCWIWMRDLTNLQLGNNRDVNQISIRAPDTVDQIVNSHVAPLEPTCNFSGDCMDWANSYCHDKGDGQKRCYCNPGYEWEGSRVNCTNASTNFVQQEGGSENKKSMKYVIVSIISVAGVVLVLCCINIIRRTMFKRRGNIEEDPVLYSHQFEGPVDDLMGMEQDSTRAIDVPFYSLDIVLSATDKFSDANKLGRGGFGPVYKGKFPGGQEIAVKRLSSCSGQGIKEFQNEVVLISKLQHRNLVRLLGYSLSKHEKILLYEYMPNRSLDAFIFDQENRLLLDWKKRFNIILGIARGLLYLHQDSRLRVIHRDLKTSNILLDENMNPKISDFGLARIVEGKGAEASTKNVVGTLGYMSPEYALEGKFSTKSDVFSFGVVLLEIVSGKKNTGFYNPEQVLTLLRYAWILWTENKALDLTDPALVETYDTSQVMKCINIGLLCVQEDPGDRPTMSNVVVMLDSETSPLPPPTQPAFVVRRRLSIASSTSSSKPDTISNNELTISMDQGR